MKYSGSRGGGENKMPWGQGVIYFVRYLGGSGVFHWSSFSLKVITSWGPHNNPALMLYFLNRLG